MCCKSIKNDDLGVVVVVVVKNADQCDVMAAAKSINYDAFFLLLSTAQTLVDTTKGVYESIPLPT